MLLFYYNNKGDKSKWTRAHVRDKREWESGDTKAQFEFIEKLKCNIYILA